MNINIRQEKESDYKKTEAVVEKSFKNAEHTDHKEHFLVSKLRKSNVFIPELSLVAEVNEKIIGHIMFTKSLALAPVSILPEYQNKGIGSSLVMEGLRIAKKAGFKSVIVLGHDKYYPRFGFKPASNFGIKAPFDVPDIAFMALELYGKALNDVTGTVIYGKEFLE